jgi:hypothetical protein
VTPLFGFALQLWCGSRDELQDLWAALLANAMIDGGRKVRRDYFDVVRQMEPFDALLLDLVGRGPDNTGERFNIPDLEREIERLGVAPNECEITLRKLTQLGCAEGRTPVLMPLGRGLLEAVPCRLNVTASRLVRSAFVADLVRAPPPPIGTREDPGEAP